MAAAVGLLSCSYGTPKSGAVNLPPDVPPVPPLPAQFMDFNNSRSLSGNTMVTPQQSSMRNSYRHHETKDIDMDDDNFADEEDYRHSNSRSRGRIGLTAAGVDQVAGAGFVLITRRPSSVASQVPAGA